MDKTLSSRKHANGRVSERRCRRPLPSEPDVRVSPHPAQADAKPRVNGAGVTPIAPACRLYDTRLQPSHPALPPGQRTHTWMSPRSFAFPLVEGSTGSLVTIDRAGSRPACAAGLKPQPLSVRLQDGLCFLQRSSARIPTTLLAETSASLRRNVGFTMFLSNSDG